MGLYLFSCCICSIELSIQKMYKLLACIQPLEAVEEKLEMWNDSGHIANLSCHLSFVVDVS